MSEHQTDTAFLRECLLCDDTAERHQLGESITQLQRKQRCVRRAVWLMAVLAALAVVGLGYRVVLCADYPDNMGRFSAHFMNRASCALGLGSLICLVSFAGLGVAYRRELDQRREECRRLAEKLLQSRSGKPAAMPSPGAVEEQKIVI
jgi:hypothetical protein